MHKHAYISVFIAIFSFLPLILCLDHSVYAATELKSDQNTSIFTQIGHSRWIGSVAYSPDGQFLASGGGDKLLKLWDIKTGREIKTFRGHQGYIDKVAYSPDGRFLASASTDQTVILWDIQTGNLLKNFKIGYSFGKLGIAFSPEGRFLAMGVGSSILIFDIENKKSVQMETSHTTDIKYLAYNPDGRFLVSGSGFPDESVKIWDIQKEKELDLYKVKNGLNAIAYSPDGSFLALAHWSSITILDIQTGKAVNKIITSIEGINSISFSPDGRFLASGGKNSALKLLDVQSGTEIKDFQGHSRDVRSIDISPDGQFLVSASSDMTLRLWDINSGREIKTFEKYSFRASSALFSFDGRVLASTSDNDIYYDKLQNANKHPSSLNFWDIETGRKISTLTLPSKLAVRISLTRDFRYLAFGDTDYSVKLWDIKAGREIKSFEGHSDKIYDTAFSPDGSYLASVGREETIKIWDLKSGKELHTLSGYKSQINAINFSPDSKYLASVCLKGAKLWDIRTGGEVKNYEKMGGNTSIAFSPNGRFVATGDWIGIIRLIDLDTGKVIKYLEGLSGQVIGMTDNAGKLTKIHKSHHDQIDSVAFSPDGRFLVSGSRDQTVKLWDVREAKEITTFNGHLAGVNSVAFSPDGRFVASASTDSTTKLWDITSKKEIVSMISYINDEWLTITPDSFFNSSKDGGKYINVVKGMDVYNIDQFFDKLYRPDIVQARINFTKNKELKKLAAEKLEIDLDQLVQQKAPLLSFIYPSSGSLSKRDVEFKISIQERGGGIGKLIWKINGVTIGYANLERGFYISPSSSNESSNRSKPIIQSRLLTLSPGKNIVEAVVFNKDNTMSSLPAVLELVLKDDISDKPSLHILAIGINKYRDKSLWLNYAVPDVKDLTKQLEKSGRLVFDRIQTKQIFDAEATLEGLKSGFEFIAKQAKTNDVFILYMAGHGITMDGRYHFLPVDFRYRNEESIRKKAINQDHLQKWMSLIQASKSLVLLDTCNSGSFVEAQAVARGIAEKTAIDKLIRATGRATISASTDSQVALEGIENHGVFTYALMKALERADKDFGNNDGVITTSELASFVDEIVPDLTYKKWGYEQIPQVNIHGRTFPIGVTIR
ncbi:caspase family protein [bacterium]|nr:caspase family protein [bacterium]